MKGIGHRIFPEEVLSATGTSFRMVKPPSKSSLGVEMEMPTPRQNLFSPFSINTELQAGHWSPSSGLHFPAVLAVTQGQGPSSHQQNVRRSSAHHLRPRALKTVAASSTLSLPTSVLVDNLDLGDGTEMMKKDGTKNNGVKKSCYTTIMWEGNKSLCPLKVTLLSLLTA